jgi:isopentenyl phosphate kinase
MSGETLCFLKLGGSLITDKNRPHTPRVDVLARLAGEIRAALNADPSLRLIVGHGSGSFGHVPAHRYHTRAAVQTPAQWAGFVEVWREARALNQLVVEACGAAGVPVIAMPPSAGVIAEDGFLQTWDLAPMQAALSAGLVPLVNGDVIFDSVRGGTILSTEELFTHLARRLHPQRILLAGIEDGVWADFPGCTQLIQEITPANLQEVAATLRGSASTDVTGGMLSKVGTMLDLAQVLPELEVLIFSGCAPGQLQHALGGARPGTRIFRGLRD